MNNRYYKKYIKYKKISDLIAPYYEYKMKQKDKLSKHVFYSNAM